MPRASVPLPCVQSSVPSPALSLSQGSYRWRAAFCFGVARVASPPSIRPCGGGRPAPARWLQCHSQSPRGPRPAQTDHGSDRRLLHSCAGWRGARRARGRSTARRPRSPEIGGRTGASAARNRGISRRPDQVIAPRSNNTNVETRAHLDPCSRRRPFSRRGHRLARPANRAAPRSNPSRIVAASQAAHCSSGR